MQRRSAEQKDLSPEQLQEKRARAIRLLIAAKEARESLEAFIKFMMPNPAAPDLVALSDDPLHVQMLGTTYRPTPQGKLFCQIIEDVEAGRRKRIGVSIPPQHGKTIHLSTFGPAWIWGRNGNARMVVATYNEDRAAELGDDIKAVLDNPRFRMVFPEFDISKSSKSKTAMRSIAGGKLFFVGQGSGTTGKTADYFIIDDPIKDDIQVQSDDFREKLWKWFFSVAYSRGSNRTRMIVLHTRWHEDDLLGRLCDPNHPERKKKYADVADDWEYMNVPGVITDPKLAAVLGLTLRVPQNPRVVSQFGSKPMAALWEEEKDLNFFSQWKRGDKRSFGALVQGEPTPDDGAFFSAEDLVEYNPEDLPTELRFYGASDHAASIKRERDSTVLGSVGVDTQGDIWVLPDVVWDRMETNQTVEEMLAMFKRRSHFAWWMEDELISKSFGPFLRERMRREQIYTPIYPVRPSTDKLIRARSIQGRLQLKTVHFPRFAPWWSDARAQMLRFPFGAHDDFVDFLSHIGNGLDSIISADGIEDRRSTNVIQVGSPVWLLRQSQKRALREQQAEATYGW
jgi:predicted phage terminase large subunit-like protein